MEQPPSPGNIQVRKPWIRHTQRETVKEGRMIFAANGRKLPPTTTLHHTVKGFQKYQRLGLEEITETNPRYMLRLEQLVKSTSSKDVLIDNVFVCSRWCRHGIIIIDCKRESI